MTLQFKQCLLLVMVLLAGCAKRVPEPQPSEELAADFRPDIGPRVSEVGRPAVGNAQEMALGDTGFRALVSASHYTDVKDESPDFYRIAVERMHGRGSVVYFERQFLVSELPASVLTAKVEELVSFDAQRRMVTFAVGSPYSRYTLPALPARRP